MKNITIDLNSTFMYLVTKILDNYETQVKQLNLNKFPHRKVIEQKLQMYIEVGDYTSAFYYYKSIKTTINHIH